MRNALKLLLFSGVFLTACEREQADQNIVIDNNIPADADVEAVPPDESSTTPTDELVNGDDENETVANDSANSL